jgi:hypothetical protein
MFILTPPELQVVEPLSNGVTLTDAAAQAGIHRNTIANWRLNSPDFREALATARHDRAVLYRERAVELADLAFETLRNVLTGPKSSPSIRLRAAIFIIDKASPPSSTSKSKPAWPQPTACIPPNSSPKNSPPMHKNAQPCTTIAQPNQPFACTPP